MFAYTMSICCALKAFRDFAWAFLLSGPTAFAVDRCRQSRRPEGALYSQPEKKLFWRGPAAFGSLLFFLFLKHLYKRPDVTGPFLRQFHLTL